MKLTLTRKLILAFLLVAGTSAALVAVFIRLTNVERVTQLVLEQQRRDLEELIVTYYNAYGTLLGIDRYSMPQNYGLQNENGSSPAYYSARRISFGIVDETGIVVSPMFPSLRPGMLVPVDMLAEGKPVIVNDKLIAVIISPPIPPSLTTEELAYILRTNRALLFASAGAILLAVIVGAMLASRLTHPLNRLKLAAQQIAGGSLEQEVKVASRDEIGELAQAFNQMSRALAHSNTLRRQMTADIAHDLRTPLTVISGYLESMQDGILPATPERLAIINREIERLQNLVEDLNTLSRTEGGEIALNLQSLAPALLINQAVKTFQHEADTKKIALIKEIEDDLPLIRVDESRMMQVIDNLMVNALRYTPEQGTIRLQAKMLGDKVALILSDTGQGISAKDLPNIFERFYRGDASRNENTGESGLGLAIAKAYVLVQAGTIQVDSSPGQGSTFTILLPPAKTTE